MLPVIPNAPPTFIRHWRRWASVPPSAAGSNPLDPSSLRDQESIFECKQYEHEEQGFFPSATPDSIQYKRVVPFHRPEPGEGGGLVCGHHGLRGCVKEPQPLRGNPPVTGQSALRFSEILRTRDMGPWSLNGRISFLPACSATSTSFSSRHFQVGNTHPAVT